MARVYLLRPSTRRESSLVVVVEEERHVTTTLVGKDEGGQAWTHVVDVSDEEGGGPGVRQDGRCEMEAMDGRNQAERTVGRKEKRRADGDAGVGNDTCQVVHDG